MIAYCICANDQIEAIVLDNIPQAEKLMESRCRKYFVLNQTNFIDFKTYKKQVFWHIHEVEVTETL